MSAPSVVFAPEGSGGLLPSWKGFVWRHPEWWALTASALAWLVIVEGASSTASASAAGHAHGHGAMLAAASPAAWVTSWVDWLLMIVAMMVPMVIAPIRTTAARSLWARRHRAIGGFLLGYVAPWAALGLIAAALVAVPLGTRSPLPSPAAAAIAFAAAGAWQLTPLRGRALRACHRTMPLAPFGWRADRDCLRYGWTVGCRCVATCGVLMVACVFAHHEMAAMTAAAAVGAAERYVPRLDRRLPAAAMAAAALAYVRHVVP